MPVFDQYERAGFNSIQFPVKTIKIRGGLRHHLHEWRYIPGAEPEKLGRKPYVIEMGCAFHATIKGYGPLYPGRLATLRKLFEAGTTAELVIPTIGRIQAFCSDWEQMADFKVRSGEEVPLTFVEDQTAANLVASAVRVNAAAMSTAVSKWEAAAEEIDPKPSIFDTISDAANAVLSYKDQFDAFGGLLESKLLQLATLVQAADKQVTEFLDPVNYRVLYALHELLDSTIQLQKDVSDRIRHPQIYTTPALMTLNEIALAIYGNTEKTSELMLNNPLADPFEVPAGQALIWFEDLQAA